MRLLVIIFALFSFYSSVQASDKIPAASNGSNVQRHTVNVWEKEIGYTGVTQVGKTLYLSGIPCSGDTMQRAVTECYKELTRLLKTFNAGTEHIIKETIYTTDIAALTKAIPERKNFFNNEQYPAATWVQVSRLFDPKHLLEIELIVQLK